MAFVINYNNLVSTAQSYQENSSASLAAAMPAIVLFAQKRISRECKILGLQRYATSTFFASTAVIEKPSRWLKTLSFNYGSTAGQATGATVTAGGTGYVAPITVTSTGGGFTTQPTWQAFQVNGVITQIVPLTPGAGGTGPGAFTIASADGNGTGAAATMTVSTQNTKRNILYERAYEYLLTYWPDRAKTGTPKFYADYDWNNWLVAPTPTLASPFEAAYYELAAPIDADNQTNWLTENAPDMLLYATLLEANIFLKNDDGVARWQAAYDRASGAYRDENTGRVSDRTAARTA